MKECIIKNYQEDFSVVSSVNDVTVEEQLEFDIARISLQSLQYLTTDRAQGVVRVGENLEVINLSTLIWKP